MPIEDILKAIDQYENTRRSSDSVRDWDQALKRIGMEALANEELLRKALRDTKRLDWLLATRGVDLAYRETRRSDPVYLDDRAAIDAAMGEE